MDEYDSDMLSGDETPVETDIKSRLNEFNHWPLPSPPKGSNSRTVSKSASKSASVSTSSSRAKTFFCDHIDCDKAFTRPSLLTEHQQSVHLGLKPFDCNQCDKSFTRKAHLERHLLSHLNNEERPFHCSVCKKGVITQQQLKRHEITHTKSFVCPYKNCSEAFYKHPQLRSHIMATHLQTLTCKHCNKTFQRPYRLEHHIKKHHNPDVATPYHCSFSGCLQSFKTWTQLTLHTKNDHPKLQCSICQKHVIGETGLQMHMKIHDDTLVTRNWKCHLCKGSILSFPHKQTLIKHYNESHPQELLPSSLETLPPNTVPIDQSNVNETPLENNHTKKRRKINGSLNDSLNDLKNQVILTKYLKPPNISISSIPNNKNNQSHSAMELLLNTIGRKLKCPYNKCYRTFKTKERFSIHVEKHKIHQEKLKQLEQEKTISKDSVNNSGTLEPRSE
ncbi:similar to Saccharomyces cerevisiae YPR186C PZF1 Transcription factor IIIA (TFIIIA) [Maudiozyma barnettii]|uniref:Similar to Saccharomyces cerevisiae YPR186C PZF1 Transcription factor IIIA (TFIIIA) n=1 Tax=Maudiozyma barnettii TaxID=61262 RepID=A0A8H2VKX2_9SACH|nr:Pzf1p [Kazachstania barnettii]CAB4257245.1 similar to Saccharomyces cerevisiae YPR186C PZF1 Transcription factor IIIA (TFIIIA) [Kazachstania barnettii]CAD1779615.1 similar to Saccharomyces cerevisiae YPR186C PZF1 Transcription factor IIIA (TFIIIA) [Kazachstania barnettii]